MQQIIKISLNLVIITFVLFSSLKLYSENSETLKAKINSSVVNQINDSLSVNTKIKSVKVSWIGFYPKVYLSNISISDNRDQILLNIPSGEVYINTINTFDSGKISIDKVIINDTKLDLKYDKNKIFFNKKNLVTKRSSEKQNNIPIIILNNSDIRLTNINSKQYISLKANNLFASYNDQILKIHSNFIHDSSQSPITINYEGKLLAGVLESKLFISGNSVKVPYHLLPEQMQQIKSSHMSLRVWLNLIDSNLVRASGNISTDILAMNIGESIFKMKNINSDLLYVKDRQSETLGFMRMNYEIDDTKINDNKIVIKKDKNKDIKIFLKKNNKKIFDEIMPMLSLNVDDFLDQTTLGNIENIQVHLSKEGNLDYYDLSINNFSLKYRDKYRFNNLSADMFGSLRRGKVKINTLSINDNGKNLLKDISGELFYASKGNSIYFSSSNFENNKGIKISFTGSKTSKTPSIKISIQSRLDDIVSNLNISDEFSTLEYDGMINTNIYYHADTIFSEIDIEDLMINNADVFYVSSSKIKLYTASTHIYSDKFDLSINDERFSSRITTRSDSKSQKFILTSNGVLDIKKLKDHIDVKDLIDGKTKIKAVVTYDYHQKELSSFITSNLEGVKLNLMEPLNKTKNENANFILKYQH